MRRTVTGWERDAREDAVAVIGFVVFASEHEKWRKRVIRRKLSRLPRKLERFCWRVLRHLPPECSRTTFWRRLKKCEILLWAMK